MQAYSLYSSKILRSRRDPESKHLTNACFIQNLCSIDRIIGLLTHPLEF